MTSMVFNPCMEFTDIFRYENDGVNYHVYEGLCDERPTKWITKTKWDFLMILSCDDTTIYYTDSNGDFIIVLEKDDPDDIEQWNLICNKNTHNNTHAPTTKTTT